MDKRGEVDLIHEEGDMRRAHEWCEGGGEWDWGGPLPYIIFLLKTMAYLSNINHGDVT